MFEDAELLTILRREGINSMHMKTPAHEWSINGNHSEEKNFPFPCSAPSSRLYFLHETLVKCPQKKKTCSNVCTDDSMEDKCQTGTPRTGLFWWKERERTSREGQMESHRRQLGESLPSLLLSSLWRRRGGREGGMAQTAAVERCAMKRQEERWGGAAEVWWREFVILTPGWVSVTEEQLCRRFHIPGFRRQRCYYCILQGETAHLRRHNPQHSFCKWDKNLDDGI